MAYQTNRRDFLKTAALGLTAMGMSASSYARIKGANDRISIAQIGCGERGTNAHMVGVHQWDKAQNVEYTVVCDPYKVAREKAASLAKEWYGRAPKQCISYREVMAMDDVDAVMIASCDHQHTTHLEAAARAKKDVYCEKPLGMDFKKLKRACDAVRENNVVFQAGTQLRSFASFNGCRAFYQTGALGKVGKIEQHRNAARPYWYAYLKDIKPDEVDWKEFLMDAPVRPFDPVRCSGWYGYRETSDGPVPGLASHFIDLVHFITGAKYPTSCVAASGSLIWNDDYKFTCPDTVEAQWIYPEGFMVSYSTNFGSGNGSTFNMFGNQGAMDMQDWNKPVFTTDGLKGGAKDKKDIEPVECPDHMLNWLECLRTRKTCNADIDAGYQHALAVIMAVRASDTGRRQVYNAEKRTFQDG